MDGLKNTQNGGRRSKVGRICVEDGETLYVCTYIRNGKRENISIKPIWGRKTKYSILTKFNFIHPPDPKLPSVLRKITHIISKKQASMIHPFIKLPALPFLS